MIVPLPSDGINVTTQWALIPLTFRSTCIVEAPEIVRAPLVVKVPVTLGNVEKSYTPVMVTGTGVGGEADAEGTEPIVKQPIKQRVIKQKRSFMRSKAPGFKVQSALQDRQIRVTGKKRDELQSVIQFVRGKDFKVATNFKNFRD